MNVYRYFSYVLSGVLCFMLVVCFNQYRRIGELERENSERLIELSESAVENSERLRREHERYDDLYLRYIEEVERRKSLEGRSVIVPRMSYEVSLSELLLLCRVVRAEAGTDAESQAACCSVVLNRVFSPLFPDSIYEVVYQKDNGVPQFSVAYDGSIENTVVDTATFNTCIAVLCEGTSVPSDVLYFYSESLSEENWVKSLNEYARIGGTVYCYGR